MIRQFYVWGEAVKRSMNWLSKRLIKVGAWVSYHARRWYVQVATAFPPAHHYRAVLAWGSLAHLSDRIWSLRDWYARNLKKLTLKPELCYVGPYVNGLLREKDRFGVFTRSKRNKKPVQGSLQLMLPHNLG
jgi:hypothetical protein